MKKLCGYQLALVFAFSLWGLLLCTRSALATDSIYQDEGNGTGVKTNFANLSSLSNNDIVFSNTISNTCLNSLTFVHVDSYTGIPFTIYQYDGVSMADSGLGVIDPLANLNTHSQVFIIKEASRGTKNIYIHNSNMNSASIAVTTFCNVDQDTPFDSFANYNSSNYWEDTLDTPYFNITNDNSFLFFESANRGGNQTESNAGFDFITPFAQNNGNNINLAFGGGIVNSKVTGDYYYLHTKVGANPQKINVRYWVLNYKANSVCGDTICQTATENCSNCSTDCGICQPAGSLYWAGVGSQYGLIGSYWNIPVYYNFCDTFDLIKYAYITIGASDTYGFTPVLFDKTTFIGPQKCSGIVTIDSKITETTPYTGNMAINLFMGGYGTINSSADEALATTTMPVIISTGISSINYLDPIMANPLKIFINAGTTTQQFAYNFTNLAWSGGEVCLFNAIESLKSTYCTNISSSTGIGNIEFPNQAAPIQLTGQYVLYSSSSVPIYKSKDFRVNWVTDGVECVNPTLDLTHTCDNFDTSGSGFTLGNMTCGLVKGLKATGFMLFNPDCYSLGVFKDNYNIFKRAFPFNAFFDLTDIIDKSIASSTSISTTTIGVPFINQNATTTKDKFYILPVLSSSSVATAIGTDNKNTFRLTIGFLFWILGAIFIYFTIRKV